MMYVKFGSYAWTLQYLLFRIIERRRKSTGSRESEQEFHFQLWHSSSVLLINSYCLVPQVNAWSKFMVDILDKTKISTLPWYMYLRCVKARYNSTHSWLRHWVKVKGKFYALSAGRTGLDAAMEKRKFPLPVRYRTYRWQGYLPNYSALSFWETHSHY
jgi:hypothetical protein